MTDDDDFLGVEDMREYLAVTGAPAPYTDVEIEIVLNAEIAAQRAVCRIPVAFVGDDGEVAYATTPDLAEALRRRVAHTLAVRKLPLGMQAQFSDFGATSYRVGGTDAEVRRLEAPYRRLTVG